MNIERYLIYGDHGNYRYKFGSGGGGKKFTPPPPTPPGPTIVDPEVTKARDDIRERLKRARGRSASRVTGGSLGLAETNRPVLAEVLG